MSKEPPMYQQAFMHSIEQTVLIVWKEFPHLQDKDVEYAFQNLKDYYRKLAKSADCEEPLSTMEKRQVLMDEILNRIDLREEMEADAFVVHNPDIQPNGFVIPNLPAFYARCFSRLIKSVRQGRKQFGSTGYLHFIRDLVL